jgi:hypothetical protein
MSTPEDTRTIKMIFADAVEAPASAHKVIAAAKALRELYRALPDVERKSLIEWVRLRSNLDSFISGEDKTYFIRIAVPKKGLRRANLEHLERYSSEETGTIEAAQTANDEYTFNIWKSEWPYIEGFLKQMEIAYRIMPGTPEGYLSPQVTEDSLS